MSAAVGTGGRAILLAGASGLVGAACLEGLLEDPRVARVVVVARRPTGRRHAKLAEHVADLASLDSGVQDDLACDAALCALGTTIAKAGSQQAFRAVDHDAVLAVARAARRGGARRFVLVSSVGADADSGNFYLRVKGEVERAREGVGFYALDVLRPSLLLGERAESRRAEAFARRLAPIANLALPGPLRKYRAIEAGVVAAAMVSLACADRGGRHLLHFDEIVALAAGAPPAIRA